MRCSHIVATGAENVSQALSGMTGFSVQGDSPAADNLTHKFLLRYYLFSCIIAQFFYISSYFTYFFADMTKSGCCSQQHSLDTEFSGIFLAVPATMKEETYSGGIL